MDSCKESNLMCKLSKETKRGIDIEYFYAIQKSCDCKEENS